LAEEIICQDLRENVLKGASYLKDLKRRNAYIELAKNVDYSTALADLLRELNELLESQYNQESLNQSNKEG